MEVTVDEVAVLLGGDAALAVHAGAAGMADDLAHHVLRRVVFESRAVGERIRFTADRPLGDVVGPFVRCDRRRRIAELWIQSTDAAGNPPAWAGVAWRPFLPSGNRFLRRPQTADRTFRLRRLHASRVVVPNAAGRFALLPLRFRNHIEDFRVASHAAAKLGAEMDEIHASRPDPNISLLLVRDLLQVQVGHHHLPALVLQADAERDDSVANQGNR